VEKKERQADLIHIGGSIMLPMSSFRTAARDAAKLWTRDSRILLGGFLLTIFLIIYIWWPLAGQQDIDNCMLWKVRPSQPFQPTANGS
jgi:hypothetical protein